MLEARRYDNPSKVIVEVTTRTDRDGNVTPLSITWEDGTVYEIDRADKPIRRASQKAGGTGMRYTISVCGREKYLFFDDFYKHWFVERKK